MVQVTAELPSKPRPATPVLLRDRLLHPPRMFVVTAASTVLVVGAILAAALWMDNGHLVYVMDDPGIHLSVVNNLVHHGTWGVVPGHFESASSSPGWTLLLAALTSVVPSMMNVFPFIANVAAGVWLIWIFTTNQRLVDVRDRSWSAIALSVVLGVIVLYIPALALLGMEHTLQCALVLYAFVLLERLQRTALTTRALLPLVGVMFLASSVRFESMFVAAGIGVAFMVGTIQRVSDVETRSHWRRAASLRAAALVAFAAAVPIVVVGLVDWSFGHRFFPNSIVVKSALAGSSGVRGFIHPFALHSDLYADPLVLACVLLAGVALIWAWCGGPRRTTVPATAFLVTVLLHANFADFGWFERYQAYLVVVGVYLAFQILAEVVPSSFRTAAKVSLVLVLLALSVTRIDLTVSAPRASSNTYRQRYQLGLFFEREYAHQAVATTELGYASLFHEGPFVDLVGIGSHEILDLRDKEGINPDNLAAMFRRDRVKVAAVVERWPDHPTGWELAGIWVLNERLVPGPDGDILEFWAPAGAGVTRLRSKLHDFEPRLPSRVVTGYAGPVPPA